MLRPEIISVFLFSKGKRICFPSADQCFGELRHPIPLPGRVLWFHGRRTRLGGKSITAWGRSCMGQRSVLEALMGGGDIRRSRDLICEGVAAATIQRALAAGWLEQVSRGTYRRKGAAVEDGQEFAEVLARVPTGVICLHSAAALHALGEAAPRLVWVAVPHKTKPPALDWPKVRWVRWRREAAFRAGVTERSVCGVRVNVTSPARTVVDMLDVRGAADRAAGLQALRDYLARGGSPPELRGLAHTLGSASRLARTLDLAEALAGPA